MAKRITAAEIPSKRIPLMDDEIIEVGLDVHKKDYRVTLWSEMREKVLDAWVQPARAAVLIKTLAPLQNRIRRVVYEAGPTGYSLARALREAGFDARVVAPSKTPQATGQEAKSDRLDSRKLAMYSAKNMLHAVQVPTEEEEGDRQIVRMRGAVVKKRRRAKQQIKSFLLQHGFDQPEGLRYWSRAGVAALRALKLSRQLRFCLDGLIEDLDHFERRLRNVEKALGSLGKVKRHAENFGAMKTVPGVGPVTAMTVRTEMIAPERFGDPRQVSAMQGLAPLVRSSGETRREGPLMKTGNTRLRTILIEAAWRWIAKDPWARERFEQLAVNTGSRKKAVVAMARRLGIILWRINVTGEAYRPKEPCGAGPRRRAKRKEAAAA